MTNVLEALEVLYVDINSVAEKQAFSLVRSHTIPIKRHNSTIISEKDNLIVRYQVESLFKNNWPLSISESTQVQTPRHLKLHSLPAAALLPASFHVCSETDNPMTLHTLSR